MTEKTEQYVNRTLSSGVVPVDLVSRPVRDCQSGETVALITSAYINSIVYGVLSEEEFFAASDMSETGVKFALHCLKKAFRLLHSDRANGAYGPVKWISVRFPAGILLSGTLQSDLLSVTGGKKSEFAPRICLVFGAEALPILAGRDLAPLSVIRSLGYKIGFSGVTEENFPAAQLFRLAPDVLFTGEDFLSLWRTNAEAALSYLRFFKTLGCDVVAEGDFTGREGTELAASDCFGYAPPLPPYVPPAAVTENTSSEQPETAAAAPAVPDEPVLSSAPETADKPERTATRETADKPGAEVTPAQEVD